MFGSFGAPQGKAHFSLPPLPQVGHIPLKARHFLSLPPGGQAHSLCLLKWGHIPPPPKAGGGARSPFPLKAEHIPISPTKARHIPHPPRARPVHIGAGTLPSPQRPGTFPIAPYRAGYIPPCPQGRAILSFSPQEAASSSFPLRREGHVPPCPPGDTTVMPPRRYSSSPVQDTICRSGWDACIQSEASS